MKVEESGLFELCLEVNRKTNHDVFLHMSGHISGIDVWVHLNGWKHDNEKIDLYGKYANESKGTVMTYGEWKTKNYPDPVKFSFYFNDTQDRTLNDCMKYLNGILSDYMCK